MNGKLSWFEFIILCNACTPFHMFLIPLVWEHSFVRRGLYVIGI